MLGLNVGKLINLRNLPRTGWVLRGIPASLAESVVDHLFLTTLVSMLIVDKLKKMGVRIDSEKVLKASLLHDIPEAITGDVVRPLKAAYRKEFESIEENALRELGLGDYVDLFVETGREETLESLIVKLSDDLATLIVGVEECKKGFDVSDIVNNTRRDIVEKISKPGLEIVKKAVGELFGTYITSSTNEYCS